MQYKKNKFLIFFIFNLFLLLIVLLLSIPATKFLSRINLDDNEFVEGQTIINPEAISPKIIDRKITINFVAKVDSSLEWKFKPLQDTIDVKIGENKIIEYEHSTDLFLHLFVIIIISLCNNTPWKCLYLIICIHVSYSDSTHQSFVDYCGRIVFLRNSISYICIHVASGT